MSEEIKNTESVRLPDAEKLVLSSSPHVSTSDTVRKITKLMSATTYHCRCACINACSCKFLKVVWLNFWVGNLCVVTMYEN